MLRYDAAIFFTQNYKIFWFSLYTFLVKDAHTIGSSFSFNLVPSRTELGTSYALRGRIVWVFHEHITILTLHTPVEI